ncbi:hypothetical protein WJX72_003174 [[Myrmecia] bisecta]|uniref:Chloride channel protein n=1 Tax=[Myrmecia] bisecta TaxID=41462 RepID=A0AAW1PL01_9CHLO
MPYKRLEKDDEYEIDGLEMQRVPSKGALRSMLDSYESAGSAENFAVRSHHRKLDPREQIREHMVDTLKVFKEHGIIYQHEYADNVPAAVHGAPKNAEESKETLERLRRMDAFESQDFDTTDNDVERATQIDRDHIDYIVEESWRWAIAFFIGLTMGFLSFLVDIGLEHLNNFKFSTVKKVISSHGGFWAPYFTFIAICLSLTGISGCLTSYGSPLAAGSGIPEIKTYLNGVHIKGLLGLKTLVCKLTGVTCSMSGGLIAGKEGPFVHSGGIVGGGWAGMGSNTLQALFGKWYTFKTPRNVGGFFRNDADHRDFVSIGTAAGVSTAFAAPIGGLLLAMEEGSSFYSTGVYWRGFLSTCTGVLTLHFLASLAGSPSLIFEEKFGIRRDLGLYDDDIALYGSKYYYFIWELPVFVILGIIAGCLGALFIKLHVKFTAFRGQYIPPRLVNRRLCEVLFVAWLTATTFFVITYASPCQKLPPKEQLAYYEMDSADGDIFAGVGGEDKRGLKHFPRLWCKDGEYNRNGQLFFTPLIQAMRMIIHFGETMPGDMDPKANLGQPLLLLWAVVIFTLMQFTFGIGAATGIFMPSLAVGGAWGRIVGMIVQAALHSAGSDLRVSLPAYTVVGAAAMLGGVTRMTLSITVLAMEGTGSLQMIIPIMLAVFISKVVGDSMTYSIYDVQIKIRGAPVLLEASLESHQRMVADKLTVSELATTQLVAVPPVMPVRELVETLQRCGHQAFPVTPDVAKAYTSDETFPLHGVIKRITLLHLLKHKLGFFSHPPGTPFPSSKTHVPKDQKARYALLAKLEQFPLKIRIKEDQDGIFRDLTTGDLEQMIDLRPFMQRTPFIVHGNASLARAYRLFRTMGLHHMYVGPAKPQVVGVITRKDVTEENAELVLGMKANQTGSRSFSAGPASGLPFVPTYQETRVHEHMDPPMTPVKEEDENAADDEQVSLVMAAH